VLHHYGIIMGVLRHSISWKLSQCERNVLQNQVHCKIGLEVYADDDSHGAMKFVFRYVTHGQNWVWDRHCTLTSMVWDVRWQWLAWHSKIGFRDMWHISNTMSAYYGTKSATEQSRLVLDDHRYQTTIDYGWVITIFCIQSGQNLWPASQWWVSNARQRTLHISQHERNISQQEAQQLLGVSDRTAP